MAINKATLGKDVNGQIEYIYPKTSSDMVKYTIDSTETVKDKLDAISNSFNAIGGRNYILGTRYPVKNDLKGIARAYSVTRYGYDDNSKEIAIASASGTYFVLPISIPIEELNANTDYFTFSCEMQALNFSHIDRSTICLSIGTVNSTNQYIKYADISINSDNIINDSFADSKWVRVIFKPFILNAAMLTRNGSSGSPIKYVCGIYVDGDCDVQESLFVRYMKLERGKSATEWSMAPEDITSQITNAVTTIKNYHDDNIDSVMDSIANINKKLNNIIDADIPAIYNDISDYDAINLARVNNVYDILSQTDDYLLNNINDKTRSLHNSSNGKTIITPPDSKNSYLTISDLGLDFEYFSEEDASLSIRQNMVSINTSLSLGDYIIEVKTMDENGTSTINIF